MSACPKVTDMWVNLSTGHSALLQTSWRDCVCSFALITQVDAPHEEADIGAAWGKELCLFSGTEQQHHPPAATSHHRIASPEERTDASHVRELSCWEDCARGRRRTRVIGAWVGFHHCASDSGSYHNKWPRQRQTAAGETGVSANPGAFPPLPINPQHAPARVASVTLSLLQTADLGGFQFHTFCLRKPQPDRTLGFKVGFDPHAGRERVPVACQLATAKKQERQTTLLTPLVRATALVFPGGATPRCKPVRQCDKVSQSSVPTKVPERNNSARETRLLKVMVRKTQQQGGTVHTETTDSEYVSAIRGLS
ncbi:unnamed protein product [Pleuronectes platessa]|uniref:Uncharacterized protein n=1 Tax=Pleuronectes platessa TaxID=8262 RepID=A0A9N7W2X3_PLEPL|nr:unnamed protein product [Pleuronectes platessa]